MGRDQGVPGLLLAVEGSGTHPECSWGWGGSLELVIGDMQVSEDVGRWDLLCEIFPLVCWFCSLLVASLAMITINTL